MYTQVYQQNAKRRRMQATAVSAIAEAMHGIPEMLQERALSCYFTEAPDMLEIMQDLYSNLFESDAQNVVLKELLQTGCSIVKN